MAEPKTRPGMLPVAGFLQQVAADRRADCLLIAASVAAMGDRRVRP